MRKKFQFRSCPHKASLLDLGIPLLALFCCPVVSYLTTGEADSSKPEVVNLTVGRKMICAEHGETVYINCYLNVRHANLSENAWSLSWQDVHLEKPRLRKANETRTVSRNSSMLTVTSGLSVCANWSGVVARAFTCVARYGSSKVEVHSKQNNETVLVRIKPWPISNISLRFSETAEGKIIINAFWKSLESAPVVYVLKYCITAGQPGEINVGPVCPHYGSTKSICRFRENDSYDKVLHTNDMMCKATWKLDGFTPLKYREHRVYVASQRTGCETNGKKHGFCLDIYANALTFCPKKFKTLYFFPQPVVHVNVSVTNGRNIQVSWSDLPQIYKHYRNYIVLYNCSTNAMITTSMTTSISLHDFHAYRPYALCEFCVRARIANSAVLSKSVCKIARLHEEVPSGSPSFSCFGIGCETKSDGIERNVTITWDLPQKEEWNGVLENVKLICIYHNRAQIEVSDRNLTKRATVLRKLSINGSYVIKIVACNKEGCSSPGNSMAIPSLPPPPLFTLQKQLKASEESIAGKDLMMTIGFPVGIGFMSLIGCVVLSRLAKRRSSARSRDGLPPVSEPFDYDSTGYCRNKGTRFITRQIGQEWGFERQ